MRTAHEIHTLVEELDEFEPSGASADTRASMLRRTRALRAWTDAVEARWLAEWASTHGERHSGLVSLAGEIRDATGITAKQAQERTRTARHLARHPHTAGALNTGDISREHAEIMSRAAQQHPEAAGALTSAEAELVRRAAAEPVDEFARTIDRFVRDHAADTGCDQAVRQRTRRKLSMWVEDTDRLECLRAELETVPGRTVKSALLGIARQLWRSSHGPGREPTDHELTHQVAYRQVLADALVEMARRATEPSRRVGSSRRANPRTPMANVLVLIDLPTLRNGLHEHTVAELADGTPLPVETIRRLACEANLLPAVLGAEGEVLDLGRAQRLASAAQRDVLDAMWAGCCFGPCTAPPEFVEAHHIDHWEHGGPTDLINLAPCCTNHHHLVHEGGWSIRQPRLGVIEIRSPDGHLYATVRAKHPPPPDRASSASSGSHVGGDDHGTAA